MVHFQHAMFGYRRVTRGKRQNPPWMGATSLSNQLCWEEINIFKIDSSPLLVFAHVPNPIWSANVCWLKIQGALEPGKSHCMKPWCHDGKLPMSMARNRRQTFLGAVPGGLCHRRRRRDILQGIPGASWNRHLEECHRGWTVRLGQGMARVNSLNVKHQDTLQWIT